MSMDTKKPFWNFRMLSPHFSVLPVIFMCRHCGHIEKVAKENRDKKLMEHLMDYCDKTSMDHLDSTEYLEKIESGINNYVNSYTICDDINFK